MFFLSHLIYSFSVIYGNTQSLFYELFYELILNPKLELYNYASFVAAEDNGEIIGLTAYYRNSEASQLYIPLICVDSSSRSRGVGSMMLSWLTELSAEGFSSIALEVKKTNIPAYQFYKKHGFIEKEDRGEKSLMVKTV